MNSHTSLVAQQTRLSEWAEMVRNCQNRPQGMKIEEWCQQHDITKASYYWRLQIASLNGHLCHIWRPACDLNGGQPRTH